MKKLMIAAAIVCAAAMSQAASTTWNWNYLNSVGEELYTLSGVQYSGVGYLFAGEDYEAYFNAWNANKNVDFTTVEGYATSVTFTDGVASKFFTTTTVDDETPISAFTLVVKDAAGNLFINESVGAEPSTMDVGASLDANVAWTSDSGARSELTFVAADGFQDIGYYAVPEPTSGLLLLLGVAGLALKRRRA